MAVETKGKKALAWISGIGVLVLSSGLAWFLVRRDQMPGSDLPIEKIVEIAFFSLGCFLLYGFSFRFSGLRDAASTISEAFWHWSHFNLKYFYFEWIAFKFIYSKANALIIAIFLIIDLTNQSENLSGARYIIYFIVSAYTISSAITSIYIRYLNAKGHGFSLEKGGFLGRKSLFIYSIPILIIAVPVISLSPVAIFETFVSTYAAFYCIYIVSIVVNGLQRNTCYDGTVHDDAFQRYRGTTNNGA